MNNRLCSFDDFLASVEAPPRSKTNQVLLDKVQREESKYWIAHFWDCEENPLTELQNIIETNFPSFTEVRITLEGGSEENNGDTSGHDDERRDDASERAEGGLIYQCHVLLELRAPLQVDYCDLAVVREGKHVIEPWSFEQAEEQEVLQGKESGMWMQDGRTLILQGPAEEETV